MRPGNCISASVCVQFFPTPRLLWPSDTIRYDKAAAMAYLRIKNQDDNFVYCVIVSNRAYVRTPSRLMLALATQYGV